MKVAVDVRESGTRKYKPASPRAMYPSDVTFCLRYTFAGSHLASSKRSPMDSSRR